MRFYVAAPRELAEQAQQLMARLNRAGHEITYDWVAAVKRNPPDNEYTDEVLAHEAQRDKNGVRRCHVLVVLGAPTGGSGVWVEMGMALAWERPIHYIGPYRTIFQHMYNVMCWPDLESWLKDPQWRKWDGVTA